MIAVAAGGAWLLAAAARAAALDPDTLAKKQEGWYATGLPLVNYSSDTGLGYGARVYLYADGARSDDRFASTPYLGRVYLQYFATTGGWQYHMVDADTPGVAGARWRLRGRLAYERNTGRNYYGVGTRTLRGLPAADDAAYQRSLDVAEPLGPGSTDAAFHRYDLIRPFVRAQAERVLAGPLAGMVGAESQKTTVRLYDGRTIRVDGADRVQGPTLLGLDRPTGVAGGWFNLLKAGLTYDTRDFEPAPHDGWLAELIAEWTGPALGSAYRFTRETLSVRRYQPLARPLVLALRASCLVNQGTPPFFDESTFAFVDGPTEGLGGGWTLRGYRENRFAGAAAALANAELRWDVGERVLAGQRFGLTLVGLADGGRVFDSGSRFSVRDWKGSAGGGIRIAWNLSTIVHASYGRSGENSTVFVDFGQTF